MRQPRYIMVHHSFTEDSKTVSWAAIEKYHKETNGWLDIGYHMGVELIADPNDLNLKGYAYQALVGRSVDVHAAACPEGGMNDVALHVCCVGNYDEKAPEKEMLDVLLHRIILPWSRMYGIPPERWVGHRDYNPHKSCPGKMFDLNVLRNMGR